MRHKGGPRLLVTDRETILYLERARVHVEGDRIVYHISDDEYRREYNIPHVNLAILFLGQGTSITQSAMRLLGEEHVHLAVTGTGGTPLHLGAMTTYTSTRHFREFLPIYQSQDLSLKAAKSIMQDRSNNIRRIGLRQIQKLLTTSGEKILDLCDKFDEDINNCDNNQTLMGFEGQFTKKCYAELAKMSGLENKSFQRTPGRNNKMRLNQAERVRKANQYIDHGNYLSYGIAGAALWVLGIPPHMAVLHGKTRPGGLVFDLADSFKDAFVLPLAFATASQEENREGNKPFREKLITLFDDKKVIAKTISSVEKIIKIGIN